MCYDSCLLSAEMNSLLLGNGFRFRNSRKIKRPGRIEGRSINGEIVYLIRQSIKKKEQEER